MNDCAPPGEHDREQRLRFDRFELNGRIRQLSRDGTRVRLRRKPMALLRYLIEHRDRVVSKSELLKHVWPGVSVSDDALQTAVRDLRRALGERGRRPRLIQTLRGDGYRFMGKVRRTSAARVTDPEARLPRSSFVERELELTRLRQALEAARTGSGSTCVVLGHAGIGKTRTALELARSAERLGMQTHTGRCSSISGSVPFAPWVHLLRACMQGAAGAERDAWVGHAGPALYPLLPDLAPAAPRALLGMDRPQARFAVANGFVQFFAAAACTVPRLVVLEDLHWADPDSMIVLDLLAQSLADVPLLLLVTVRSDEPQSPELRRALDMLARAPASEQIWLEGLSEAGVRSLLTSAAATAPAASLVSKVHEWTGGNPLFVTELLPLHARGELDAAVAGLGPLPIPRCIRDVIELRLAARSPSCQHVLRSASVLDEPFSLELLACAIDLDSAAVLDAVSEAELAGILHELAGRPGAYGYAHSLWRESLYAGLSRIEARRLHLRAATALETLFASDLSEHLVDLAHHYLEAVPLGASASASRYARQAVLSAIDVNSYQTALKLAARALQAFENRSDVDPSDHAELYIAYVQGLSGVAADGTLGPVDDEIARAVEAALRLARQAQDADLLMRVICLQSDLALVRFHFLLFSPTDPARLSELRALLELLREGEERGAGHRSHARIKLLLSLSSAHWHLQERAAARTYLEEAERLAQDTEELESRMNVAVVRMLSSGPDLIQASLEHAERLLRAGEAIGSLPAMGLAQLLRLPLLAGLGRIAETRQAVQAAEDISHQIFRHTHPLIAVVRSMLELLTGHFERAETQIEQLEVLSRRMPYGNMLAFAAGLQRIWLRFWQGRSVEVLHPLEVISRTFAGSPTAHLVLARCYVDLARMEEARIELERALLNGALEVPFDGEWILIHALAAEIVHLLDAAPCARPLYDKLRPYADRMAIGSVATLPTGSVSRALGLLAATLGSLDLAIDHLEAAVLQHESIESPPLLAWTLVDMARVLERRHAAGDPARSRRLARAALGIGRKLGMQRLAASAEELL